MTKNGSIRPQILEYLANLPPLRVVSFPDLYALPFVPKGKEHSVRSALYGLCAGTPVAKRDRPNKVYGIRLSLPNNKTVVLSLPGVPWESLQQDHHSDATINRIINRLQKKHGVSTIDYWGKAAQKRSVDQASPGMRAAKSRDGHSCLLCGVEGISEPRSVSACHIVSRKASFWLALDEVDKTKNTIFTDEATRLLSDKLKKYNVHSDSQFIVTLCTEHNSFLLDALKNWVAEVKNARSACCQESLFEETTSGDIVQPANIIEIGGEGGSLILCGAKTKEIWCFKLIRAESTLAELLDEPSLSGATVSGWTKGWRGALRLLAVYPWKKLYPRYVHPEFKELVAREIAKRGLTCHERDQWHEVLTPKTPQSLKMTEEEKNKRKKVLLERALMEADKKDRAEGLL